MDGRTSIKTNFIYSALYQLTSIVVPLVTLPYLSRILRAEGLGEYSFAFSVANYFYLFIRLGLYSYGNRTIAFVKNNKLDFSRTFISIYVFQLLSGIVLSCLYSVYVALLAPDKRVAFIFLLILIGGCIEVTWVLYGLEEFRISSLRDIAIKLITTICIFLFVKTSDDVWVYSLIYSAGFFISQLIVLPTVLSKVQFVKPNLHDICRHIKPNLILFLPTVAVSIYRVMDNIMLGAMANKTELGYYHNCDSLIKIPMALITALGTIMLPRISNMLVNNTESKTLESYFEKSVSFSMFLSTSIAFGIMTVANEFVPLFFGNGFEKCVLLSYIILPSCVFVAFANVIRTQYLLPRKMDKQFVISLFAGAGVNLFLNSLLIPKYASVGAAIGTLFAEIVVCVVQSAFVFLEANIARNVRNALPYVITGIAMYWVLHDYVVPGENGIVALGIKILLGGLFYLTVLGLFLLGKQVIIKRKVAR